MDDFEVHPVGTAARLQPSVTGTDWRARCMVAEDRIAKVLRLLDDYRERGAPMPTYAQLMRALLG